MNNPILTKEELAAIRERSEAATPGEWSGFYAGEVLGNAVICYDRKDTVALVQNTSDMYFIAHARQDIPALLDALEAETKRADEVHEDAKYWYNSQQRWLSLMKPLPNVTTGRHERRRWNGR